MTVGRRLLPLLLLIAASVSASEIETFELQHRSAEELIPILRPMVEDGGAISGQGYILIIRSGRENLQQLGSMIERLDKAPKMLRITVDRSGNTDRSSAGVSVSGTNDRAQIGIYNEQQQNRRAGNQHLQVTEGHWATIRSGQSRPQVVQQYRHTPGGAQVERHIEYRDIDSGFEVRPHLSGRRVTLEVRPFRASPSSQHRGTIEKEEMITTVSGPLGEWIEIGGTTEQQKRQGQGILYSHSERGNVNNAVRIKVELANP